MIGFFINKIFGTRNDRFLKSLRNTIQVIGKLEPKMQEMADDDFKSMISGYKERYSKGEDLDKLLPEVFALVREASKRVLGMRHYDVQLLGGISLHQGKIAEMKTGEGKTLMATLPVVLNAISGKGVHVVTVNDYLAKRDSEWMGKLYSFLGLSCGVIVHGMNDEERRNSYASDITYGTNNEFGFDYLRDNMKFNAADMAQRGHNFAIVDEVDSILIDEARTPLIISGAGVDSTGLYRQLDEIVKRLKKDTHFTVDEKSRTALLSEEGVEECEQILKIDNLFDPASITLQHHILQALRAHNCYNKDVDYIVNEEGKVIIVDEFTGRLMPGRRYGEGLHQAIEAKERVKIEAENQTLASITFQNYFRMYTTLAGMTGTAQTEAVEFMEIYGLETISIPTNMPMIRKDFPDFIYRTQREKYEAIVKEIKELHEKGQPVLVGTISIESSEFLSVQLKKHNIPHNVLNAKHHAQEAEIVAEAGQKGHVTIATNMAGRGTDIVLGEGVKEVGGLHILGTERHESRRIDNQLRGRSGRQGDPGSSRFYLSLEDNLMRIFGSERISNLMQRLGMEDGEHIENRLVSKAIENAQKKVEAHNFEIRKTLLDYDNVMNQQRTVIYNLRREFIFEENLEPAIYELADDVLDGIYDLIEQKEDDNAENRQAVGARLMDVFTLGRVYPQILENSENIPQKDEVIPLLEKIFLELKTEAPELYADVLRYFLLEELDRSWKEHLRNMDHLREGIGLRGYGQRDPKLEYKREGLAMMHEMLNEFKEGAIRSLTKVRIQRKEGSLTEQENAQDSQENNTQQGLNLQHKSSVNMTESGANESTNSINQIQKVGRNDLCPCGSGKKYKRCHGMDA